MPPQWHQGEEYDFKADIWSLGIISYELCCLKLPFFDEVPLKLSNKIIKDPHPPIPSIYSKELKDLVDLLLQKDPQDRPSIKDIFNLDIIKRRISSPQVKDSKENAIIYKKDNPIEEHKDSSQVKENTLVLLNPPKQTKKRVIIQVNTYNLIDAEKKVKSVNPDDENHLEVTLEKGKLDLKKWNQFLSYCKNMKTVTINT